MSARNVGDEGFVWFFGVVEDIDDPKQLGRVRIRIPHEHSDEINTDDLPWATPMSPVTSANLVGVGSAPVGISIGSRCIGFYIDGKQKQKPMIIGTFPFIGEGRESNHSLSKQARGERLEKETFDFEPETQSKPEYPYNKVITTSRGHVIELDDTPGAERVHVYHRSGSYIEMNPDGSVVARTIGESFEIAVKDKRIASVEGDILISTASGEVTVTSAQSINLNASGSINISSASGVVNIEAPIIGLNA